MNKESYVKAVARASDLLRSRAPSRVRARPRIRHRRCSVSRRDLGAGGIPHGRPASGGARVQRGSLRSGASRRQETQAHQDDSYRGDRRGGRGGDHRSRDLVGIAENRPCGAKLPPNRAAGNRACAGGGRAARRGRLRNAAVDVDRRNESGSQRRDDGASEGDHGSR